MNLKEQIRRILREETKIPYSLRRRFHYLDNEVEENMKYIYTPNTICRFGSGEKLLEVITEKAIGSMYFTYFKYVDDFTKDWEIIYELMVNHINDKYGEEIKKYYHMNCGN